MVYAISKFRHYIIGYEVLLHTNHSTIRYIMNKPVANGIITRWLLLLHKFDITILDRLGSENQVVDFLSRLSNEGEDAPVNGNFLDENLFSFSIKSPWFKDMTNYLATRKLPPYFSSNQKKKIIRKSANYSWIKGDFFFTGPDLIICRCFKEDEVYDIL